MKTKKTKKSECIINGDGTKKWYLNGKLHRIHGPAIEWANGGKSWYKNGKWHRIDGPAIEFANGDTYWYLNGKCHRINGPAAVYANGTKFWWLNGKPINPQVLVKKGYITKEELFLMLL